MRRRRDVSKEGWGKPISVDRWNRTIATLRNANRNYPDQRSNESPGVQMNFDIFGGFEIPKDHLNRGIYDRMFWEAVDEQHDGLSRACGCYVLALRHGGNTTPVYVGKAEKLVFRHECFSPSKRLLLDRQLDESPNKRPILYLVAKVTDRGRLCKPTRREYPAIRFLENLLIGMAIERNPKLANIKQTKYLKEMFVPGIINSGPGQQTLPVRELQGTLGLS